MPSNTLSCFFSVTWILLRSSVHRSLLSCLLEFTLTPAASRFSTTPATRVALNSCLCSYVDPPELIVSIPSALASASPRSGSAR